jgi:hypothetical protein
MTLAFKKKEDLGQAVNNCINKRDISGAIAMYKQWKGPKASVFDDKTIFPKLVEAAEKSEAELGKA